MCTLDGMKNASRIKKSMMLPNHLSHIIQSDISYESLAPEFFAGVISLGNHVHGDNYLTNELLADYYAKSFVGNTNASWVALYKQKVVGFRLTFAHTQWEADEWYILSLASRSKYRMLFQM